MNRLESIKSRIRLSFPKQKRAEFTVDYLNTLGLKELKDLHSKSSERFLPNYNENVGGFGFGLRHITAKSRILRDERNPVNFVMNHGDPYISFYYLPLGSKEKISGYEDVVMTLFIADFVELSGRIKSYLEEFFKDMDSKKPTILLTSTNEDFAIFLKRFGFYRFLSKGGGVHRFETFDNVWMKLEDLFSDTVVQKVGQFKETFYKAYLTKSWDDLEKQARIRAILYLQKKR
ncbi:hypothetical protein M1328_00500 [Patescibacteria group bacterium]|nr:hypothetical protein [Patescibacteria group bacterium]